MSARAVRAAQRRLWSLLAIPAALALVLGVNWLAQTTLTQARLDLTEDRRHTLSAATRAVLAELDEPIVLSFYRSPALDRGAPQLADHARRVRDLLDHYVRLADGRLKLELYRPEPYSPAEDLAVAEGLRGVPVAPDGATAYFGLAGRNSTDDREAIELFAPERARFLEYDLTRLVHALAHPERPRLAIVTALPMAGDPARGVAPWQVVERLREGYEVRFVDPGDAGLPDGTDAVLLAQAAGLSDGLQAALLDDLDAGRPMLALVDPFSETLAARRADGDPPAADAVAAARPLLARLGLSIDAGTVIGDRPNARRVRARIAGRTQTIDYLPWIALGAETLAPDDPATANLSRLALNAAGAIRTERAADLRVTPLARSSDRAMAIPVAEIAVAPDPAALLSAFVPTGQRYDLAVRVQGDGPDGVNAVVVADADLLDDAVWTRQQQVQGRAVAVPTADNGAFVVNLMDTLTGGRALLALRGRSLDARPFERIEAMREAAETKYRAQERSLSERVRAAEARIRELRRRERDTGVVLSDAQRAEVDRLRADMLAARRELRAVQHRLRADVETLQTRVRLAATWGMPALVVVAALGLGLWRRRRRGRLPAARG